MQCEELRLVDALAVSETARPENSRFWRFGGHELGGKRKKKSLHVNCFFFLLHSAKLQQPAFRTHHDEQKRLGAAC